MTMADRPAVRSPERRAHGRAAVAGTAAIRTLDVLGLDLAADGAGFAALDGRRVLIDGVIPGERVEVRLRTPAAGGVADVVRVVRPSVHRVAPVCRHFGVCGGCAWQHIAYGEQRRLKAALLQTALDRALGRRAPRVQPVLAATGDQAPWGFRDKVHFVFTSATPAGRLVLGHYRRRSRSVVAVDECPVHPEKGNRVAFAMRDAFAARRPAARAGAVLRHLVVRVGRSSGRTLATLVVTANDRSLRPAVRALLAGPAPPDGLHVNVHAGAGPYLFGDRTLGVAGVDRLEEVLGGVRFLVSPTAFFQTNVDAASRLLALVLDAAEESRRVLDLYAGAGLFALPLARRGHLVTAVEENPQAVADGEATRRFNGIRGEACRFVRARVEDLAGGQLARQFSPSPGLVVLDPPRAGCPAGVLAWVAGTLRPARVVYVSCNPLALAADLPLLVDRGYVATLVQPVDMFPHAAHLETVVVLARTGAGPGRAGSGKAVAAPGAERQ